MDTATNTRFKNRSLKNTVSESGYKIFVTPVAQSKLDEIQGHARLKVDKAIHSLASVPRPTDCDKFSIK